MSSRMTVGNIFRDLGKPKDVAENLVIRSRLMMAVQRAIKERKERGETQEHVAILLGVDQPRISNLIRGRISLFSIDALVNIAVLLGLEVEISVVNPSVPAPEKVAPMFADMAKVVDIRTGSADESRWSEILVDFSGLRSATRQTSADISPLIARQHGAYHGKGD